MNTIRYINSENILLKWYVAIYYIVILNSLIKWRYKF